VWLLMDLIIYKKARTREINKHLLMFNYRYCFKRPILEFHSTMVENSIKGLENVFDTIVISEVQL
jgi:hypothetical protein